MKLIRNGVFETNSSSAHSLSFGTSKIVRGAGWGLPPDETDFSNPLYHLSEVPEYYKSGTLIAQIDDFGWGYDELDTAQQKFEYLLATLGYTLDEVFKHPFYEQIKEWLFELGINISEDSYESGYDQGYIDHQSHGVITESLFKTKEDLITYLFNDNLVIHIENDNDEYQEWYTGERNDD